MLVLTRKPGQGLVIANQIVVTVLEIDGDRVKVGIQAPGGMSILRQELQDAAREANLAAARSGGILPDAGTI